MRREQTKLLAASLTLFVLAWSCTSAGRRGPLPRASSAHLAASSKEPPSSPGPSSTSPSSSTPPRSTGVASPLSDPAQSSGAPAAAPSPRLDLSAEPDPAALAARAKARAGSGTKGAAAIASAITRMERGQAISGSCWDYVSAVYKEAGFTGKSIQRVYSAPEAGPYADPAVLRPGDWVSFRNIYSASVSHSAIFVEWIHFESRTALMIDHPGGGQSLAGRYRVSDLSKLWQVQRPAD